MVPYTAQRGRMGGRQTGEGGTRGRDGIGGLKKDMEGQK